MECDRSICFRQDYNGGCATCPCNELTPAEAIDLIEYKGFNVSQSKVNHRVMVFSDEYMVMNVSVNKPLTDKELMNLVDFYLDFAGGENHGRTV